MDEKESYKGYLAIRNSAALEDEIEMHCLLIKGRDAFKLLDQICPCNVFLQNGQMRHTLLLDDKAVPFADVYVCRNREDAYLLGYWNASVNLVEWIKQNRGSSSDFSIIDLNESESILTVNGPYAWELCAQAIGHEILGMPYLSMMTLNPGTLFRAGVTGEFGYHLLVPVKQKDDWIEILVNNGMSFDLAITGRAERAQCSIENFFFDLGREGMCELTPPELQLQWRLSRGKSKYPGAAAMQDLRVKGWDRRLTCFVTDNPASVNDGIFYEDELIGQVLSIGYSPVRKEYVGKALIRQPYWHAGLSGFKVNGQELGTISSPAIDNLSIQVNPNIHSYSTRKKD